MKIYVKSAGFSVNQDYSWMNQNGKNIEMDLTVLSYNVDGIKFVWRSTADKIYIFGNAFTDKSRTDLYNRPLRNYVLLEGQTDESEFMFTCFEKMILNQENFESMLNGSVRNEGGDSESGFSVDFQKISAYFDICLFAGREAHKVKRHLYEKDSYEARQELLKELWGMQKSPVMLLVGGELSDGRLHALAPDRALLSRVSDAERRKYQDRNSGKAHLLLKTTAALGAVILASSVLALAAKKD